MKKTTLRDFIEALEKHRYSTEVIKDQDTSFPIPDIDTIYLVISRTKNSSPGQDGILYSAWGLIGHTIAVLINKFFLGAQKSPAKAWSSLREIIKLALFIPKKDTPLCA
eukprot:1039087-Heterocapsa_arctica.AAC.1